MGAQWERLRSVIAAYFSGRTVESPGAATWSPRHEPAENGVWHL